MVTGSVGQMKPHPALAAAADQQRLLDQLVRALNLPLPDEEEGRRRSRRPARRRRPDGGRSEVARWRDLGPQARIEGPAWYRIFDPAAWAEPDDQEQAMIDGCPSMRPWPDHLRRWHAERRWHAAKHRYRQDHPALAEQEWEDLVNGDWRDRGV